LLDALQCCIAALLPLHLCAQPKPQRRSPAAPQPRSPAAPQPQYMSYYYYY